MAGANNSNHRLPLAPVIHMMETSAVRDEEATQNVIVANTPGVTAAVTNKGVCTHLHTKLSWNTKLVRISSAIYVYFLIDNSVGSMMANGMYTVLRCMCRWVSSTPLFFAIRMTIGSSRPLAVPFACCVICTCQRSVTYLPTWGIKICVPLVHRGT